MLPVAMEKKLYSSGGVNDLLSQCAVELREICVLCAAPSKGFTYREKIKWNIISESTIYFILSFPSHYGIAIRIKRRYHVKHLYYRR
jgi:hypothetical protein